MESAAANPRHASDALIERDIEAYLLQHRHKSLLRFITCGSVDDGKSTLIGRLLYDSKMIFEDQLDALRADSKKMGTQGQNIDFALLVDGLAAEREQGITIDVAYRFFATEKRKFIVADTPGHEQYTRNMITGASTADLAVVLIDARKGVLTQTRRHSYLAKLIGVRNFALAVNKMDLIGYGQAAFEAIVADYRAFARSIGNRGTWRHFPIFRPWPATISALDSINMPWYRGPTLIEASRNPWSLDVTTDPGEALAPAGCNGVNRPQFWIFRGFFRVDRRGNRASRRSHPSAGRRVKTSTLSRIVTFDGDLGEGRGRGQIRPRCGLADEIDCFARAT